MAQKKRTLFKKLVLKPLFYKLLLIVCFCICYVIVVFSFHNARQSRAAETSAKFQTVQTIPMSYRNLFAELGYTPIQIQTKLNAAWDMLFYGDTTTERVYYPVGTDMAYIKSIDSDDIRSEGMSYGMMIAVQMNKKEEFDRLWKWSKTYMYNQTGEQKGFFAWRVKPDFSKADQNPAPDGEAYFTTALIFAHYRWGSESSGIFNYYQEARTLLQAMKQPNALNFFMYDPTVKQVVFTPYYDSAKHTDPSYHVPAFYEIWYRFSGDTFWKEVAIESRKLFKNQAHPVTGLGPDYSEFDGRPKYSGDHDKFRYDAWRTVQNAAVDYAWWGIDPWQVEYANRIQNFFASKGVTTYGNLYTLDGTQEGNDHSPGLVAMNAVASLAANNAYSADFVRDFWNVPMTRDKYRYYDGMLYLLGFLHVSGQFKAYGFDATAPTHTPILFPTDTITPSLIPTIANCSLQSYGDADCNQVIDSRDYLYWRMCYVANGQKLPSIDPDFNHQSSCDLADFEIWRRNEVK